jgi:hypothetical protein
MIINASQGDIEVVGDIKEFKTSIDPKNLEFITTLLSSNLYSDPEQSFIREIVSNAWDSHVEAGTTDIPVIIRFRESDHSVTIRDYGVGLSPQRFQEVYCNIGSSTKRESNEFIGGFGIGKYSSLACSNTVYITSYYEGTAYYYVMVKSGNSITTNLVMEKPTTEKNGVEVSIKSVYNFEPYSNALDYIVFFPNVYVDGASNADTINSAKLKRFKNFAAASIKVESKLLLGNVLYPCNKSLLPYDARAFINEISDTGIVIKFDVGEINITPNRESVIYNSDTVEKISNRIMAAKAELDALVDAKLAKDYDDIISYYEMMSKTTGYDPVSDSLVNYGGYRIEPKELEHTAITYKGKDLREDISFMGFVLSLEPPNYRGVVYDDKIYMKKLPYYVRDYNTLKSGGILVLNSGARLVEAAKLYIKHLYGQITLVTEFTLDEFKLYVKDALKGNYNCKNPDDVIEGIYDSIMLKANTLDLNTDGGYLAYKATLSTRTDRVPVKEAIIYEYSKQGWRQKTHYKQLSQALDYLKSLKKGIVLANMDANCTTLLPVAELKGYALIQARKDIVNDIKELGPSYLVDIDWLINRDPMLSVTKTVLKYFPEKINDAVIRELCDNLSEEESKEFMRIHKIRNSFGDSYYYSSLAKRDHIPYDNYTSYVCKKLMNYISKHLEAQRIVHSCGCTDSKLTSAVVMITKAYKISGKAYKRIQNNKLLRVLCRK